MKKKTATIEKQHFLHQKMFGFVPNFNEFTYLYEQCTIDFFFVEILDFVPINTKNKSHKTLQFDMDCFLSSKNHIQNKNKTKQNMNKFKINNQSKRTKLMRTVVS